MECKILGLNEDGSITCKSNIDKGIDKRGISYIIKDELNNILWEPYRQGDFEFISPFPKGYNPSIGENFLLSERDCFSSYDGIYKKCYKIVDIYLMIGGTVDAIMILIIKEVKI